MFKITYFNYLSGHRESYMNNMGFITRDLADKELAVIKRNRPKTRWPNRARWKVEKIKGFKPLSKFENENQQSR